MKRFLLPLCVAATVTAVPAVAAAQKTQTLTLNGPGLVTGQVRFGAVPISRTRTATVTLANALSDPLWVGLHETDFPAGSGFGAALVCPPADGLLPGQDCSVNVSMSPAARGRYHGKVILTTYGACALTPSGCATGSPDIVITLTGTTR